MASDRIMHAIGTLERAVGQLEQEVDHLAKVMRPSSSPAGVDAGAARAALQSLDDLITELRGNTGG